MTSLFLSQTINVWSLRSQRCLVLDLMTGEWAFCMDRWGANREGIGEKWENKTRNGCYPAVSTSVVDRHALLFLDFFPPGTKAARLSLIMTISLDTVRGYFGEVGS